MGEVRVKTLVTNAMDDSLARRGKIQKNEIRKQEVTALVDTGAVRCVVPVDVIKLLGIELRGETTAEYADGRKEVVGITEPVIFTLNNRSTVEEALVLGDEVLIGQTVLEKLDLFVDCAGQRLVPNPAHPDQAVSKVK
ncbi:MAG: clan AA aspartic protease [Acidobacteriota bacterium]|nr:clan AA aspartic protease [Acidobacteriota bacterium]